MKNWPLVQLGNLTDLISSGATPRGGSKNYTDSGYAMLIRSQNVHMNSLSLDDVAYISKSIYSKMKRSYVYFGDVLLNITGASIGRVAPFEINDVFANVNQHVCIIRPKKDRLYTRFLSYYLSTPQFQKQIDEIQHGGTRQALNFSQIAEFEIPLPPLAEQKRIAAILDKADQLRRQRQATLDKLDTLLQSTFIDMFGDPLNPRNQDSFIQLNDIADIIMGQSPPSSSYNKEGKGFPLLNGPTEFGSVHPVEQQWTDKPTKFSQTGDILICVRGATAGKLNLSDKKYCIGRGVAAIRLKDSYLEFSKFIFMVLDRYYELFQRQGVGSTFINISSKELKQLNIPSIIPSQAQIFQSIYDSLTQTKAIHGTSLIKMDNLFHSLQQRAFRGDL
ncbi:MAG TPA: restriction endonuclease subunit S [Anaerolineae bacterium]|nr:restriction endonuclease subunit S [Anaerolineae bacterium]